MEFYADDRRQQTVTGHCCTVARWTGRAAGRFGCQAVGFVLGLWHDLGKFSIAFQDGMFGRGPHANHAACGALYAATRTQDVILGLFRFSIAGHHTGLKDSADLARSLKEAEPQLGQALPHIPPEMTEQAVPELPSWLTPPTGPGQEEVAAWNRRFEFWIRMMHSCLIDADRNHAAEREPNRPSRPSFPSIAELSTRLDRHIDAKASRAADTSVNAQRQLVLASCRAAAARPPGFFSLTVPTGGGKTLSGMSFALRHAVAHGKRRVVVAIPFTSIIEQNAEVYAGAIGRENVIQHHCNFVPLDEEEGVRHELATENWEAPVIVTTNVQFFESLFSDRNSVVRKLHNLADSVILLDEAQALPPELIIPILEAMRELVDHYGCTIVLCTATQPALEYREKLKDGLTNVREIIPDPCALSRNLSRVRALWPTNDKPTGYEEIAEEIVSLQRDRVLAITHRRADARHLAELLPEENTYHLSALMCPAHRSDVIRRIKDLMKETGGPVRLVSTQLVEAGVDLDFPVVYRAMAGADSLTQAAGRCNREGKPVDGHPSTGLLVLFHPPTSPPPGLLRKGLDTTRSLVAMRQSGDLPLDAEGNVDLFSPLLFPHYFRLLYSKSVGDKGIQAQRELFNYAQTAERFRLIPDAGTVPIVVPYGNAYELLGEIEKREFPDREDYRVLQAYTVQVYPQDFAWLNEQGMVEPVCNTFYRLIGPQEGRYHARFGLTLGEEFRADPEEYIQ